MAIRPPRRVALILLLLSQAACSKAVPQLPKLAPDAVIVAFGDSLTSGTGARPEESYPAVLEQLIGHRVVNAGSPGELSTAGLDRLRRVLDEHRPGLLILCHGGNDLLRKEDTERLDSNLRQMVRMTKTRGIAVVLVGVPAPGLFPESAGLYEEIATDFELPYEGEILAQIESRRALKSDLIHPNRDGYRKLAEAIRNLLHAAAAL